MCFHMRFSGHTAGYEGIICLILTTSPLPYPYETVYIPTVLLTVDYSLPSYSRNACDVRCGGWGTKRKTCAVNPDNSATVGGVRDDKSSLDTKEIQPWRLGVGGWGEGCRIWG